MHNKYAKALDQPTREGSRIYIKSFLKKKVKQAPVWVFRVLLTLSEKKLLFRVLHSSLILWLYFLARERDFGKKGKTEGSGSSKANTESNWWSDIPG